jgi:hypothetical protein
MNGHSLMKTQAYAYKVSLSIDFPFTPIEVVNIYMSRQVWNIAVYGRSMNPKSAGDFGLS